MGTGIQSLISLVCSLILTLGQSPTGPFGGIVSKKPAGGAITWTFTHLNTKHSACFDSSAGVKSCAITVTSTTAGNLLVLTASLFISAAGTISAPTYTSVTDTQDGTWTHCGAGTGASIEGAGHAWSFNDCAYVLSAAGGTTTVTFNWTAPTGTTGNFQDYDVVEVTRSSGTAVVDVQATGVATTCSTACVGPAMSLTGNGDYVLLFGQFANTTPSLPGGVWTNPADSSSSTDMVTVGALNQTTNSALTWNQTSSDSAVMCGISFK